MSAPQEDLGDERVVRLPFSNAAPGLARAFLQQYADWLPPSILDDALLLVSELTSNAYKHGGPEIIVRVRSSPRGVGIAVSDGSERIPVIPEDPPPITQTSGRGMLVVDSLADTWGISFSHDEPGKTVWFELEASAVD